MYCILNRYFLTLDNRSPDLLNPPTYLIPIKSNLLRLKKVRHKVLTPNACNNWTSNVGFYNLWLSHSLDVSISNHIHTICKLKRNVKFRKLVRICIQISNLNKKRKKCQFFIFNQKIYYLLFILMCGRIHKQKKMVIFVKIAFFRRQCLFQNVKSNYWSLEAFHGILSLFCL